VLEERILDDEVTGEHGRRNLATVDTVADERIDESLALINRLYAEIDVSAQSDHKHAQLRQSRLFDSQRRAVLCHNNRSPWPRPLWTSRL
jgi:hypothetical protein